jgi:hypothetical protein
VEITEGSWTGWDTTFSGFFAAGEGPDIINLGSEMNTLYGESLADMDPYLGEAAWPDIANFGPALENAKYEGKLRGLPIFTAPRYVFCRTDLMEASGWTTGTPKNFAEWVTLPVKPRRSILPRILLPNRHWSLWMQLPWLTGSGGCSSSIPWVVHFIRMMVRQTSIRQKRWRRPSSCLTCARLRMDLRPMP